MERDLSEKAKLRTMLISIHALRMERDEPGKAPDERASYFNPRAPHGARRQKTAMVQSGR